ncbi:MAG: hypothetical protein FJX44_12430 [Alphaproteobacteria bacterium]|nr:hypothetical protein [Alphaproteobacteria bacterium]
MTPITAARPACGVDAVSEPREDCLAGKPDGLPINKIFRRYQVAKARARAWCRILDAVAEMRDALDHRIWREDPDDTLLEADVQTWVELARALAGFLRTRRAA